MPVPSRHLARRDGALGRIVRLGTFYSVVNGPFTESI